MRYRNPVPAQPPVEFVPWKPIQCEEPGCKAMDPSFSRNGPEGPWRCRDCDETAQRKPAQTPLL